MRQVQLNILEAVAERDAGIQKSESTADIIDPAWREEAYRVLKQFIKENPGEFMCEDIRAFAAMQNFVAPASNRIWGSIILRAAKDGLVINVRYGVTKNKKAHRTPANVWKPNFL